LVEAIIEGQESITRLLIFRGADVNARDTSGFSVGETPLIVAASKGKTEIAAVLIAKGAKVNTRTKDGQTALIYAARAPGDRSAIAKLLIENGADVNAEDNQGMTALAYALKNRDVLLFKILMESGAKE
ncbi:MAG: ankyrin repeat domain-containing protein, partial [Desulfobacterales bacterium]